MADGCVPAIAVEPTVWFLVFETRTDHRWVRWLARGRFKHVTAVGWVPDQRLWVFYDVSLGRTRVAVLPDCQAAWDDILRLRAAGAMLAMVPRAPRRFWLRVGFWCVPAVRHLLGVGGWAVTPSGFYRDCLRQGAEVVTDGQR